MLAAVAALIGGKQFIHRFRTLYSALCLLPPVSCSLPPVLRFLPSASCFLLILSCFLPPASSHAQPNSLLRSDAWRLTPWGRFDVRGRYGQIPNQTVVREADYAWWTPGKVGFWAYHVEGGVQIVFRERITTRLAVTTTSSNTDRDFAVWGNDISVHARLKEASIRLDRVGFDQLALSGGLQPVDYPLFTDYDYVGGQLIWSITPKVIFDWGQWQVFEGRTIDLTGQSSDDLDLWGPRLTLKTPRLGGQLYFLIHSKAGGSDGIGQNIKLLGLSSRLTGASSFLAEMAGVIQRGSESLPVSGEHRVAAWAVYGRLQRGVFRRYEIGAAFWAGSGDKPGSAGVIEGYQTLGYRNTLDKFTVFYRPGLTNLRLFTGRAQATFARLTGRLDLARIGQGSTGLGTELAFTLEYPYSEHARLRWQWATTFDGHRMQVYELSAGF